MTEEIYKATTTDRDSQKRYTDYQSKYVSKPRESDKVFLQRLTQVPMIRNKPFRLLDIGCSNGNLLRHIKERFPHMELVGIDLNAEVIEICRTSEALKEIKFFAVSAFELRTVFKQEFDLVIANAMLHPLSQNQFRRAVEEFVHVLKPLGQFWAFDGFHPFNQEIEIIERSAYGIEGGIPIYYRSYSGVRNVLQHAGFESVEFHPFEMPFDLSRPEDDFSTLRTYTVKTDDGSRLSMRGTLLQPWCHLFTRKS